MFQGSIRRTSCRYSSVISDRGCTDLTFSDFVDGLLKMGTAFRHSDNDWLEAVCKHINDSGFQVSGQCATLPVLSQPRLVAWSPSRTAVQWNMDDLQRESRDCTFSIQNRPLLFLPASASTSYATRRTPQIITVSCSPDGRARTRTSMLLWR